MAASRKAARARGPVPHYAQTTDFTCGPASLIMAMQGLDSTLRVDRGLELQLWREATSIFSGPTGGHGGCGPVALALAAHRRGFAAEVHVNHRGTFLGGRTRSKARAAVMQALQERDLADARAAGVPVHYDALTLADLETAVGAGTIPILLNAMDYIHRDPTAHWFVVTGFDADNVYVNDPWVDRKKRKTARHMTGYPIPRRDFDAVTSYGKARERAAVLISRWNKPSVGRAT